MLTLTFFLQICIETLSKILNNMAKTKACCICLLCSFFTIHSLIGIIICEHGPCRRRFVFEIKNLILTLMFQLFNISLPLPTGETVFLVRHLAFLPQPQFYLIYNLQTIQDDCNCSLKEAYCFGARSSKVNVIFIFNEEKLFFAQNQFY